MFVANLPQTILNLLPLELWEKIEKINKNEWDRRKQLLKERFHFQMSWTYFNRSQKGRFLENDKCVFEIFDHSDGHMVKIVIQFNQNEFMGMGILFNKNTLLHLISCHEAFKIIVDFK